MRNPCVDSGIVAKHWDDSQISLIYYDELPASVFLYDIEKSLVVRRRFSMNVAAHLEDRKNKDLLLNKLAYKLYPIMLLPSAFCTFVQELGYPKILFHNLRVAV